MAIRTLTCILLLAFHAGCAEGGTPHSASPRVLVSVAGLSNEGGHVWVGSSGFADRERLVIRSADQWALAWATLWAHVTPVPALPAVDFDQQTVVIASMGARSTGGYAIEISAAAVNAADSVAISVLETSPGPSCVVGAAESAPATAVLLPLLSPAVTFVEATRVSTCE